MEYKQPQRVSIAIGNRPRALGDSETVNALAVGSRSRKNSFPPQTFIAVQLIPIHLPNFAERRDHGESFPAFQRKPMVLKNRIVEIQNDPSHECPRSGA
jgi:hypothetical protein